MEFKKLLLLAGFGLFAAQAPFLQASEAKATQSSLFDTAKKYMPFTLSNAIKKGTSLAIIYCGSDLLYNAHTQLKRLNSTSANIALGVGALLVAGTVAAKVATSTCNSKIDTVHKNLTDILREKMIADKKIDKKPGILCFLENLDGSISHYRFFKSNKGFYIISDLTQDQKTKILLILQTKKLPENLIEKICVMHTENFADLIKNLKITIATSENSKETLSLESFLKMQNIQFHSACDNNSTDGTYFPDMDYICMNAYYFANDNLNAILTHSLLHELTHHDHFLGREYYVDLFYPFTKYILPCIEFQTDRYSEEYRAELKALELNNCKKCIRDYFTMAQDKASIKDRALLSTFEGYKALDPAFVEKFITDHPNMPETCALCQDHA